MREGIREIVNYTVRNAKLNSLFTVTKTHFPTSLAQTRPKRGHFFTQGQLSVKSEKYDPDPLPPPKKKKMRLGAGISDHWRRNCRGIQEILWACPGRVGLTVSELHRWFLKGQSET